MNLVLSILIGLLFASSIFLMLHRGYFKLIIGVILFGYATILFLFVVSGVTIGAPPLILNTESDLTRMADPLPQALTLTAIVISIGVQLFVIILLKKVFESADSEDLDALNNTDRLDK
jgi:multicomponent Na+:H+ antiporter subunit C